MGETRISAKQTISHRGLSHVHSKTKGLKGFANAGNQTWKQRESRSGKYSQDNSGDLFASMALHICVCQQNKDLNLIRSRSNL